MSSNESGGLAQLVAIVGVVVVFWVYSALLAGATVAAIVAGLLKGVICRE